MDLPLNEKDTGLWFCRQAVRSKRAGYYYGGY